MDNKKPCILLVEDQPMARIPAKALLEEAGCDVQTAENGNTAIKLVQENSFDLIFMDLGLPDITGFEATNAIRALPGAFGQTPIVALTAHDGKEIEKKVYEAGMQAFLTKPLTEEKIKEIKKKFMIDRS